VAFGPQQKEYNLSMNKKARKAALRSTLSYLFNDNKITVMDTLALDEISTKKFASVLGLFDLPKALLVIGSENRELELSARNIKGVKVLHANGLNIVDMLKYRNLVITREAVANVEGALQPLFFLLL
jgi:large subunit ribosomal protein L4